jgi:sec-independent protein translocase protein TatC
MRNRNPRGEMPFLDHLEELRWRVLWAGLSLLVCTAAGFVIVYKTNMPELLLAPVREAWDNPNLNLIYLSPADPFFVSLKLSVYIGFIFSFPIIVYQVWSFLSPALEKDEKRAIVPALYLGMVLFMAGVALAYFAALPVTLEFFQYFLSSALEAQLEINATLSFIVKMLLAFGAVFELPIVILVLSVMGLVTPSFLREKRRHAIVLITVLASFITPGDAITLTIMMMLPLVLLYEFGILLSVGVYRRRAQSEEELDAKYEASLEPPAGAVGTK